MRISDSQKAKYVFGQLTFKDVLYLVGQKIGSITVHQDDLTWEYVHFNWVLCENRFYTYDGEEKNDEEEPGHVFSLRQVVRIEGNLVHLKTTNGRDAKIELFIRSKLNLGNKFKKLFENPPETAKEPERAS